MAFSESSFEKLGAFYLGRVLDPQTREPAGEPLLYDSRDLLTHAVCVGMTGSGKTGLCLALLEEAAIDGVPSIIIDPKGDLGNLLLTFPNLAPEDFRPWINEDDALRKGMTPEDYAAAQANLWKEGLARWGQSPERIRRFRESTEITIYTPGSTSGTPVNVVGSFNAPDTDDAEALAEKAANAAAGLLALLGSAADPVRSREGILLANILVAAWQAGESLDLSGLATRIQRPPFDKVGLLDLESFFPSGDRFALVLALNNVLAAPSFASWREGAPLDIGSLLHAPSGKPRTAIFSIAHLGDTERMFFVSMLLNEILSWTRAQSGTTSLRAIVYMDEIFGYLPPSANPPSKLPLLTLLKQARAFGVGLVLATQNPVDLDYKALSNAGTWFIGRLQTERDMARMLDGLQGAASGAGFDRSQLQNLMAGLGNRVFLLNNVHDGVPKVFESRWAMSYLRGPLTRDQIKSLKPAADEVVVRSAGAPMPQISPVLSERSVGAGLRPPLPPGIPEVFANAEPGATYEPMLLCEASVDFRDARLGFESHRPLSLLVPIPQEQSDPVWDSARAAEDLCAQFLPDPVPEVSFSTLPAIAARAASFKAWEKQFQAWLGKSFFVEALFCRDPRAVMERDETPAEFHARVQLLAREARDAGVDAIRRKYAPRRDVLLARLERARAALERQKQQAGRARVDAMISIGSSILGAFLGGKALSSRNVGRATAATRGISRTLREQGDIAGASESVEQVNEKIAALDEELELALAEAASREPIVESKQLRPARGSITSLRVRLAWLPAEELLRA